MIPIYKPDVTEKEIAAAADVLRSGWIGAGTKVAEFEQAFASYIGVRHAIATSSCTAALHLSLIASAAAGSEVITTPMTYVATNHAILYCGAIPVFCDIETDSLNIDPNCLRGLITDKTRVIIVVHHGGAPADVDRILEIANEYGLIVIEDVAHGCGGRHHRGMLGSLGKFGCFSFYATKNMTTCDGGMITTNDSTAYERILRLRDFGLTKSVWDRTQGGYSWDYDLAELGYKYCMNDLAAAIGLVQLGRLDTMSRRRHQIWVAYDEAFRMCERIRLFPPRTYAAAHAHHLYIIRHENRDAIHEHLRAAGISTGVHYRPSNQFTLYRKYRGSTPVANKSWTEILTLPLYSSMGQDEVDSVIKHVRGCV